MAASGRVDGLIQEAAEKKDIKSLDELGHRFLYEDPKNFPLAMQCFKTALSLLEIKPENENLHHDLNYKLGETYRALANINYKSAEYLEAITMYKEAAALGNNISKVNYAYMLFKGLGIPKNVAEANTYLETVIKQAEEMKDVQTEQYAKDILKRVQDEESNECCARGIEHFAHGRYPQAFGCFQDSLKQNNNPEAMFYLGYIYLNALGQGRKLDQTKEYWQWAAELGHSIAAYNLACLYLHEAPIKVDEEKFPKNIGEAKKYCRRAAELGVFNKQPTSNLLFNKKNINIVRIKLGDAFFQRNQYHSAHEWYQEALHSGIVSPKNITYLNYQLALLYEQGLGVKKSGAMASLFFRRALQGVPGIDILSPIQLQDAEQRLCSLYNDAVQKLNVPIWSRIVKSTGADEEAITIIYHASFAFSLDDDPLIPNKFRLIAEFEGQQFDRLLRQEPPENIDQTFAIMGSFIKNDRMLNSIKERNIKHFKNALLQVETLVKLTSLPAPLLRLIMDMAFYEPHFSLFRVPQSMGDHIGNSQGFFSAASEIKENQKNLPSHTKEIKKG